MEASFNKTINRVLNEFLQKYNLELGYPEEANVIDPSSASESLNRVLSLVGTQRQSLFVGVDEYDAPANNSAFPGGNTRLDRDAIKRVQVIEAFFKENFFSILKQGCAAISNNEYGVTISKYFLTGVTPAFRAGISPLTATTIVSHNRSLHGICGFTDNEVKAIVKHYLGKGDQDAEPIVHSMRRLYNGYFFAMSGYDDYNSDPALLYNPHLVFHYLSDLRSEGFVAKPEESTAVHSTTILRSISDMGEFSVNDLVELIISKSVQSKIKTEFGYSELLAVGKDRQVLNRIEGFLRTQIKISTLMVPAMANLKAGRPNEFRELLQNFLLSRNVRSLQTANEAVLQGIVELLLDEPSNQVPELRLVVDGSKELGNGQFGFVDIFIPRHAMATGSEQTCVVMELKNATLEGLWKGASSRKPNPKDLEDLHKALHDENEDRLLSRKYAFWSKEDGRYIPKTLGSIMEGGLRQLQRYMNTIALGRPQRYNASGVLDSRVNIDIGLDDLQGYVVMAIGGARVLIRSVEPIQTTYEYVRALQL
ncbi:hypothetical protein BGX20_005656 [Mortierella sp. AD010]|nr:hypothetical protein BGX20_005656 [Mortierella sp. AD010]